MRTKTEILLHYLLWATESLIAPSYRTLDESFESWTYRSGFHRQLEELEKLDFLERKTGPAIKRIYRLTEKGRIHALGGRDPEEWWQRDWDGFWYMVLFDVPVEHNTARNALRNLLRAYGFGRHQQSGYIRPHPLDDVISKLSGKGDNAGTFTTWRCKPASGESNAAIVSSSWDFPKINGLYRDCLKVLRRLPTKPIENESAAEALHEWAQEERNAWLAAVSADPLLPKPLLPRGYLGKKVWRKRCKVLERAGRLIETWESQKIRNRRRNSRTEECRRCD